VVFPSGNESSEVVHPGKEPLHFPSFAMAAQFAGILGSVFSSASVQRDQLDAVFGGELFIQRVRVVGFVADESGGELIEEASGKNIFHKPALGWRSAFDRYGERKTVISGDSDDLGAFAAAGRANGEAPFLALAKVASTNASSRVNLPRLYRCAASSLSAFPVSRFAPTAETCDGKSGTEDTSPPTRAIAPRCQAPKTPRSARSACHAMDGLGYRPVARHAAPAQQPTTALRLIPNV
jgi:hypothetical protein